MAKNPGKTKKRPIETYRHEDKTRVNNPPVGLVTPETDPDGGKKRYQYDPNIDPSLQWAGKAERLSFDVQTVSLHVHERIETSAIIEAVRKKNGTKFQPSLFDSLDDKLPLREAIQFYQHANKWKNRLIAGDSLLVMNSLIEKEGLAGQVQMVYIDPPYGIKYGSNFQPFVNKRDVKDGKDEDLTAEPEMIKAFRDTWELGIHSYLTYLRDRLLLAKELLHDSGSCFVQISDENVHLVRNLMDEIFGVENFVALIAFRTHSPLGVKLLPNPYDYLVWYSKKKSDLKYRSLYICKDIGEGSQFTYIELKDGNRRPMTRDERFHPENIPYGSRIFRLVNLPSSGYTESCTFDFTFDGKIYKPSRGRSWKTTLNGMNRLSEAKRVFATGTYLNFVYYFDDFPLSNLSGTWSDVYTELDKRYVVQTSDKVIQRCLLMTTDPGDLVFDPTCGSGTTAYAAEQWGRRWITCDTSRVAITLAKQRLMTSVFDYYQLAHPNEGVGSGFKYKTVPHITLKSIANNEPAADETLYDQPLVDNAKARVAGPFTVEAVPSATVKPIDDIKEPPANDATIARSGNTLRHTEWRDELLRCGIRAKSGKKIEFTRVETLPGTTWLHADTETKEDKPQRAVISFGPEHAPLEQRQVALAVEEAQTLVPRPKIVVFAAFHFDPEAAKDIDETNWPGVTLLKAQMNADMLTEDLKKKRASNESFWLIGQPDIALDKIKDGPDKDKYTVSVRGFDYYNPITGNIDSGGTDRIAMWLLDTDYDGRSLLPQQVFFTIPGSNDWTKLAKSLKAEIDPDLIQAYSGTTSLPFAPGENKRVAVKIIDDRGIESLKLLEVD